MKGLEKIPKVVKRDRFLWWVLVAAALDGDGLMLVPAFLVSSSLPACCQSGSGQGRGSLGQDGGCRAVMWVTICLSPETTLPFTLRCCSSSSRQDKSVLALDTKPYSLLIFSSFIFLSPGLPSSSPTVPESIKACYCCSPSSSVTRSCCVPATPPAAPPVTSHPVSPLSFLHL